jgi:hypothetical protein
MIKSAKKMPKNSKVAVKIQIGLQKWNKTHKIGCRQQQKIIVKNSFCEFCESFFGQKLHV